MRNNTGFWAAFADDAVAPFILIRLIYIFDDLEFQLGHHFLLCSNHSPEVSYGPGQVQQPVFSVHQTRAGPV